MEGHRYLARLALTTLTLWTIATGTSLAEDRADTNVGGQTNGRSVELRFSHSTTDEVRVSGARPSDDCTWHAARYIGTAPSGQPTPISVGPRPSEDHELYIIWCGERSFFRWLGPRDFDEVDVAPLLEEALRRVLDLDVGMDVRPGTRGITGIESLFWVDGYDGRPLRESVTELGTTVRVTARLVAVEWDFGDGTRQTSGLGEAWPDRSSVRHAYRDPSGDEPYHIRARIVLQPTYTVDGDDGGPLDPIVVPVNVDYEVRQIQAERTR